MPAVAAQLIVNAIDNAVLNGFEAGGVKDYMVNGRRLSRYTGLELVQLRREYERLAAVESRGGGTTYVKFVKP